MLIFILNFFYQILPIVEYLIVTILLIIGILTYFRLAFDFKILDWPNERSAHSEATIRGGGIIYWMVSLLYFLNYRDTSLFFFIAITIIGLISFLDDLFNISFKLRMTVHFFAITILFYSLGVLQILPYWAIFLAFVLAIGIINAYNFMDGINGITGVYSIVVLLSLLFINNYIVEFTNSNLILYPIIASVIFLYFNFRIKAKCFAGDVGSISIAFWVIFIMIKLMVATNTVYWLLLLAVYGVDSVCTILHRMYLGQNIFIPHKLHFFQILCIEYGLDHRLVSILYGLLQSICSFILIMNYNNINKSITIFGLLLSLILVYSSKFYLIQAKAKVN